MKTTRIFLLTTVGTSIAFALACGGPKQIEKDDTAEEADTDTDTDTDTDNSEEQAAVEQQLQGSWQSGCQSAEDASACFVYALTVSSNVGEYSKTLYTDSSCSEAVYRYQSSFTAEVESPASFGDNTWEWLHTLTAVQLTPLSQDAAADFELSCPDYEWTADNTEDISEVGCGDDFPSLSLCSARHDAVQFSDENSLFTGKDDMLSMCAPDGRPAELNAWSYSKQ